MLANAKFWLARKNTPSIERNGTADSFAGVEESREIATAGD
jgi:hypothetical protein